MALSGSGRCRDNDRQTWTVSRRTIGGKLTVTVLLLCCTRTRGRNAETNHGMSAHGRTTGHPKRVCDAHQPWRGRLRLASWRLSLQPAPLLCDRVALSGNLTQAVSLLVSHWHFLLQDGYPNIDALMMGIHDSAAVRCAHRGYTAYSRTFSDPPAKFLAIDIVRSTRQRQ